MQKSGQRRLAQADASVVGRHGAIGPDLDACAGEQRLQVVQQQLILEHAAGRGDGPGRMCFAQDSQSVAQAPGDT